MLGPLDPLAQILRSLSLTSSVWSRARFTAPWAVKTRGSDGAIFHAVVSGRACAIRRSDGRRVPLETGELVLFARGESHVMCDAPETPSVPLSSLGGDDTMPIETIDYGGGGDATSIICGSFAFDHDAGKTFLELLPSVLHVSKGSTKLVEWFASTLELMDNEIDAGGLGSEVIAARLADVLFVQILRASLEALPDESAGWLAALRDPQIGRALALIHTKPSVRWTVEELASAAALSRTSFFDRFSKLVGESPARYLTRWRVHTAADLVRKRPELSNSELAGLVGYDSEDAFARAFKRHLGKTPHEVRVSS